MRRTRSALALTALVTLLVVDTAPVRAQTPHPVVGFGVEHRPPPRRARSGWRAKASATPGKAPNFGPGNVYANVPPIDDRGRDQLTMFNAWNPDPIGNHERHLARVDPSLAAVVRKAQADNPDVRFVVGSGLRTLDEQRQAESWGWSPRRRARRGKETVWLSASLRKHMDGQAVDLWPLDGDGRISFSPMLQDRIGAAMMRAARDLGVSISWGGNWRRKKDPTHFELH